MFNEKTSEFYDGENLPVWKSPKYVESKKKAIELIENKKYDLTEADFWILMNRTNKKDKMVYSGLIISHNGCLKINDNLESKFKPSCVKRTESGFNNSLIYEYVNDEQGIFEVGEVNAKNCKNEYPYAMAFKRCFDRVVLKICKLAYAGIYSDSEADEFKEKSDERPVKQDPKLLLLHLAKDNLNFQTKIKDILAEKYAGKTSKDLTTEECEDILRALEIKEI